MVKTTRYNLKSGALVEKKSYPRWELTKKILLVLGGGAILFSLMLAPNTARLLQMFDLDGKASIRERLRRREQIRGAIKRLKKNRLVEIYQKDGEDIVRLTETGKKRLLKYQLDNLELKKTKFWDKKWRVIIFDIPEKNKRAREAFRFLLKKLGFYQLQRSVFVSPYHCRDEIDFISEVFDIGKCVHYFEATYFDDKAKLELQFPNL
ncbi:MAG: CRISPR-associated endonuclease Cas2 [Candidatus Giovannonibacteria bacterium]|nr:MAG: CRISPR-associated endonuclease Cas2 [Candidatus Giovannonibacteria bacterium]